MGSGIRSPLTVCLRKGGGTRNILDADEAEDEVDGFRRVDVGLNARQEREGERRSDRVPGAVAVEVPRGTSSCP